MKRIIFLLIVIAFISGCEKINSSKKDVISEKNDSTNTSVSLVGKWSWFLTHGLGNDKDIYTPQSTHKTIQLVFTHDSIYQNFYNDTLRSSIPFHTYTEVSPDGKYTSRFIDSDSIAGGLEEYTISHDTLTMNNVYGFIVWISRYKKVE